MSPHYEKRLKLNRFLSGEMEKYQKEVMDLKRARRHYGRAWQEEGKEERCNYDIKKSYSLKRVSTKSVGPAVIQIWGQLGSHRVSIGFSKKQ